MPGRACVRGLYLARGNTDSDQLDVAVNTQFDSTRDRITLRANVEQDTSVVSVQTEGNGGTNEVVLA